MKVMIEFQNRKYEVLRGSDIQRDGMYLEMNDLSSDKPKTVLFIFYSDIDGSFSFSAEVKDLPLEAVERFIREAHAQLPPIGTGEV